MLSKSELCNSGSFTLLMRFWVHARHALAESIVKQHLWITALGFQSTADAVLDWSGGHCPPVVWRGQLLSLYLSPPVPDFSSIFVFFSLYFRVGSQVTSPSWTLSLQLSGSSCYSPTWLSVACSSWQQGQSITSHTALIVCSSHLSSFSIYIVKHNQLSYIIFSHDMSPHTVWQGYMTDWLV